MAERIGTVGMVKPTGADVAPLEDLIPFLPPGTGYMPLYLGVTRGVMDEFAAAMPAYERAIALLADQGCDLISAEGAPPFMVQGYQRESELVDAWVETYRVPIFTSPQNQANALHALGVKRLLGTTYFTPDLNRLFERYFTDRGFTVLGMEQFQAPFDKIKDVPSADIAAFITRNFARHEGVEALYLLGSGWRTIDIIEPLEQALGVPVVHPVVARAWEIQRRLHLHFPVTGYGRLMAALP